MKPEYRGYLYQTLFLCVFSYIKAFLIFLAFSTEGGESCGWMGVAFSLSMGIDMDRYITHIRIDGLCNVT